MYVIGTAGHVDHGKSTLVKALTGIDPDRWAEEQRREMTIDLGFAWLTLPTGRTVSLIDVPGHERFIKHMLAGVGGIDAAMLVVAADESLMPQTEEHLAILDLLGVEHGIVVLTKADLVEEAWLALVSEELQLRLAATSLAHAPQLAVSARSGRGLPELRHLLDTVLDATPTRTAARGFPRLSIDRSFTISGFGTVVTGTLIDGPLEVGMEVEILPAGRRGRIRGLQSHYQREDRVLPGTRVAVNLVGIHHREVVRGDLLTVPGTMTTTALLDLRLRVVAHAPHGIEHNIAVDLFVGAAEVGGRVALLDATELAPGGTGWVQVRLERPVAVARGDRCIIRQPSPSMTLGGGVVIDAHPVRHRRFRAEVVTVLETLARGTPSELLLQALGSTGIRAWDELLQVSGLPESLAREGVVSLVAQAQVMELGGDGSAPSALITGAGWALITKQLSVALASYHRRFPLRRGMPRQEVRQRLRLDGRLCDLVVAVAVQRELIGVSETDVWLAEHTPIPTATQQALLDTQIRQITHAGASPPPPDMDEELLRWSINQGLLIKLSSDICFSPKAYDGMVAWVRSTITNTGSVSVSALRDHFHTSRKYALALLEHLDDQKITRREGEGRVFY